MYSTLTVFLVAVIVASVDACSRRRPPPPPPPPTAPPAPPIPPPIVRVERTQDQKVGFNKCYRKCNGNYIPLDSQGKPLDIDYEPYCDSKEPTVDTEALNSDPYQTVEYIHSGEDAYSVDPTSTKDQRGNPCGAESKCVYECKFDVYVEVALTTITKRTGCGCSLFIQTVKQRPAKQLNNQVMDHQVADKIEITKFELVVWDYKANRVVEKVPEFKLERSNTLKDIISKQVKAGNTNDFTTAIMGFAGQVTRFPKLPDSLNLNKVENKHHVPAMKFTVVQTYEDTKLWKAPKKPNMADMPNAYQSQCVPYWPKKPFCYNSKKRQANKACGSVTPTVWMKHFFLFTKKSHIAKNVGQAHVARKIVSFYKTADCNHVDGIISFDAHFKSTLKASTPDTNLALGVWAWERQFNDGANGQKWDAQYVLGVPSKFSSIRKVWDKGYSEVSWEFPTGHTVGVNTIEKLAVSKGICQKFIPTNAPQTNDKYGETGKFYRKEAGIVCEPFDAYLRQSTCGTEAAPDRSLMAFLNEGEALNFNKRPSSELLMGKMESSCRLEPYPEMVFDVLTFTGCPPGMPPHSVVANKRDLHAHRPELGLVYDEELEGFVHFLHPRGHIAMRNSKRSDPDSRVTDLENSVATPRDDLPQDYKVATGSVAIDGTDGANAGDHPLALFPETFSAPVNIDPQANAPKIVEALVTTGTDLPACHRGTIGCSCRTTGAMECDLGLSCGDSGKCLPQNCLPGQPGCVCQAGECQGDNECVKSKAQDVDGEIKEVEFCRSKRVCTPGSAGCECDANKECEGELSCAEGQCLHDDNCTAGEAGCSCTIDRECTGDGMTCDETGMVCIAPRCQPGSPGCRCQNDGSCNSGFECTAAGVCALYECPLGHPGCQCNADKTCNKIGFDCVEFTTTGDSRCVAEPQPGCFPQVDRCQKECGAGNVAICPPCTNGMVLCRINPDQRSLCEIDPFSPQCASAGTMFMAVASVLVAIAALF